MAMITAGWNRTCRSVDQNVGLSPLRFSFLWFVHRGAEPKPPFFKIDWSGAEPKPPFDVVVPEGAEPKPPKFSPEGAEPRPPNG